MGIVDFSLDGKVAIVTGGSKGIGRAIALAFAEHGADLVLAARGLEALEQARQDVAATGRRVLTVQADMSVSADCDTLYQATVEEFGGVDILVNNAAGASLVTLAEENEEDFPPGDADQCVGAAALGPPVSQVHASARRGRGD